MDKNNAQVFHAVSDPHCHNNVCPECLIEESETLWLVYYEQYRQVINALLSSSKASDYIMPVLNLVATYIELWLKTIGRNYGMGAPRENSCITVEKIKGHNLDTLMEKVRDSISWEEYCLVKDNFFEVWGIIDGIVQLTSFDYVPLSEATRYPETKKHEYSLNPCLMGYLTGSCEKFQVQQIIEDIRSLMKLTYSIFDVIYSARTI